MSEFTKPGRYVYGVVRSSAGINLGRVEGVARSRSVSTVEYGGVATLVADVDPDGFSPAKDDLLAHAHVLERAVRVTDVLPWRFGTIFPTERALIERLLQPSERSLTRLLDDLADVVEVQVKASYIEEDVLREIAIDDPTVRRLKGRSEGGYQARVRLGEAVAHALERRRDRDARTIGRHLQRVSESCSVGSLTSETMVANLACLVRRDAIGKFEHEVDVLSQGAEGRIHFRLLGPLPPYSFVDPNVLAVA